MEFQREPGRIYARGRRPGDRGGDISRSRDGAADIDHTFVDDTLRGAGVAGSCCSGGRQIRAGGKARRATCSYAEIWFERHPEEADLLCP